MRKESLVSKISGALRQDIASGEMTVGEKLPSEAELTARFGVSRPTVRAALKELEAFGLVYTRHGVGSFVADPPMIRAGLETMESITDSIREQGRIPGMVYASRVRRSVVPEEARHMGVPPDTEVIELRRTIHADGEVVAYSYDLIPANILPEDFEMDALEGSLFRFMRHELKIEPHHSQAEVHAVHSDHVGWGREAGAHQLFVLLVQLHFDASDRLLMHSRTYFIEGRYSFTIYRNGGPR